MNSHYFVNYALSVTTILACASFFAQWMRKFNQQRLIVERIGASDLHEVTKKILAVELKRG